MEKSAYFKMNYFLHEINSVNEDYFNTIKMFSIVTLFSWIMTKTLFNINIENIRENKNSVMKIMSQMHKSWWS